MHLQLRVATLFQGRRQIAVDFEGSDLGAHGQQAVGQGAGTGTNLHHLLAGCQCGGGQNLFNHVWSTQEILTETLAGSMG